MTNFVKATRPEGSEKPSLSSDEESGSSTSSAEDEDKDKEKDQDKSTVNQEDNGNLFFFNPFGYGRFSDLYFKVL